MSVKIDYSKDSMLDEFAITTLKDRYMIPGEESPQEAFARAAMAFADDDAHAQRLYDYVSKLWFMFSTPVLSNGGTTRGLPISCFLNYVDDSREGITGHYVENAFLSSFGGGIGGHWSDVRAQGTRTSKGSESTGVIPFIKVVDAEMLAFSQGVTRRGSYAAYLHMSHPEIEEFLDVRKPTGGDTNRKSINLHHGVVVPDSFMELIHSATKYPDFDDSWNLVDPHTHQVKKTVSARALWVKLLQNRMETGEPYLMFEDAVNAEVPEFQKKKGLEVHHSNLCSEITLATDEERTAVCCLSSVNLAKYDEWSTSPTFIPDMIRMLDNVLEHFIQATYDFSYDFKGDVLDMKVKEGMEGFTKAGYSAYRERSLGLGAMGFHTYLQKLNVPFEGPIATGQNLKMFRQIKELANKTSMELAEERGEAPDMEGTGMRNAHLLAVAPNATSSIICGGTSPSIEPIRANVFIHKTLNGSFQVRNRQLHNLLKQKWNNSEELQKEYDSDYQQFKDKIWQSISENTGSVKHLDFLTDLERDVFKTADEIDQNWIIEHASKRQEFICQAQSVNLFFVAPRVQAKQEEHDNFLRYTNKVHYQAWKKGLKSLYYLRSREGKSAENINLKVKRVRLEQEATEEECLSCEA